MNNMMIWQYKSKPKASATVGLFADELKHCFENFIEIGQLLNIDTATKWALDLVGFHVGVYRILDAQIPREYFGWSGDDGALAWSVGEWYRYGDSLRDSVVLNDTDFRFMIKCRVVKNYQRGDLGSLIEGVRKLLGQDAQIDDNYNMTMTVSANLSKINALQRRAVLNMDILPRPIGVKYNFVDTKGL